MKLIDILVKELPAKGGWPAGVEWISQYESGQLCYHDADQVCIDASPRVFLTRHEDGNGTDWAFGVYVSLEAYVAALEANEYGDWIVWEGGECPVEKGTLVDVRYRDGEVLCKVPANQLHPGIRDAQPSFWVNDHLESDIVAYRLHDPSELKIPSVDNKKAPLIWDGEGLPPVGAEFEFGDHRSKARCLGVGLTMVFACWGDPKDEDGDYDEFLISVAHSKFYPVRTEEELMQETIETSLRTCLAGTGAGITELAAKNLYQAIANGSIPGVGLIKNN